MTISCFDIFDTALLRRVADPKDVFVLVYRLLIRDASLAGLEEHSENGFAIARIQAEAQARIGVVECSLEEIWQVMAQKYAMPALATLGPQAEEACEATVLYPNPEVAARIAAARARGDIVCFVSDMYLGSAFLERVLRTAGLMKDGDRLFVSCECGTTKHHGTLYDFVAGELGAEPGALAMLGDNRRSDKVMARRRGVRGTRYRAPTVNRYWQRLNGACEPARLSQSMLPALVREYGLAGGGHDAGERLVGSFLGPAAMLWALWALKSARAKGLRRLYFMARDAHLAWLCARELQDEFPEIECCYLRVSRKSVLSANITGLNESLDWILGQSSALTPARLLEYLAVDARQLPIDLRRMLDDHGHDTPMDRAAYERLRDGLANSSVGRQIEAALEARRQDALAYLEQQGLNDGTPFAFVDIGWHLNVQSDLAKLLPDVPMRGLYLFLSETRRDPADHGLAHAMMDYDFGARPAYRFPHIWRAATAAEHLFGIDERGSVSSYARGRDGLAVAVTNPVGEKEAANRRRLMDLVSAYARAYADLYVLAFRTADECADGFRLVTDSFLGQPPRRALDALRYDISISSAAMGDDEDRLIMPFGLRHVGQLLRKIGREQEKTSMSWIEGNLAISPFPFNLGLGAMVPLRSAAAAISPWRARIARLLAR